MSQTLTPKTNLEEMRERVFRVTDKLVRELVARDVPAEIIGDVLLSHGSTLHGHALGYDQAADRLETAAEALRELKDQPAAGKAN